MEILTVNLFDIPTSQFIEVEIRREKGHSRRIYAGDLLHEKDINITEFIEL